MHEGAVYLHLGEQYLVRSLDGPTRTAVVEPARVDWYTQVKKDTKTAIEETLRGRRVAGVELQFGRVSVTEQVIAYQRKAICDGSTLDVVPLILPEVTFETEAVWFCPGAGLLDGLEEMPKLLGALHAAEHALISLLPLWAMCDRWDIGGLSTNVHFQTGRRPCSSTTATPAASGSRSVASTASPAGSPTRRACSPAARARTAALPASRARSAAT